MSKKRGAVWVFLPSALVAAFGGSSEALQLLARSNQGFILSIATICPTTNSSTSQPIETTTKMVMLFALPA